jgi:hypothetical protein
MNASVLKLAFEVATWLSQHEGGKVALAAQDRVGGGGGNDNEWRVGLLETIGWS